MRSAEQGRWEAILDPRFIAALVVLLVNDHWAKGQFPGLVTGKLSDFAGMIVLPVLLATLVQLAARHSEPQRIYRAAICVSAGFMVAIKTSAVAAAAVVDVLEVLTLRQHQIVVDPTDLVGLLALLVAHSVLQSPILWSLQTLVRPVRWCVVAIALGACMATSAIETELASNDLQVLEDGSVVRRSTWSGWGNERDHESISDDDGLTWITLTDDHPTYIDADDPAHPMNSSDDWDEYRRLNYDRGPICLSESPSICARINTDSAIQESTDGGATWSAIAEWDHSEWWLDRPGTDGPRADDIVRTPSDSILVSVGRQDPVRRDPSSGAWSVTQADINPMLVIWLVLLCFMQMYLFQMTRWFRVGGQQGVGMWFAVALAGTAGCAWIIESDDGVGGGILLGGGAGFVGFILVTSFWLSRRGEVTGTRTHRVGPFSAELGVLGTLALFGVNWLIFAAFDEAWVSWETGHILVGASTLAALCLAVITPLEQSPPRPPTTTVVGALISGAKDDIGRLGGRTRERGEYGE